MRENGTLADACRLGLTWGAPLGLVAPSADRKRLSAGGGGRCGLTLGGGGRLGRSTLGNEPDVSMPHTALKRRTKELTTPHHLVLPQLTTASQHYTTVLQNMVYIVCTPEQTQVQRLKLSEEELST